MPLLGRPITSFADALEFFKVGPMLGHLCQSLKSIRMSDSTISNASNAPHASNTAGAAGSDDSSDVGNMAAAMSNFYESDILSKVQAELADLKAKSADLADQFLRAKAEAENARRRAEDEISKARKFAIEGFAESLLPVLDSLEAGLNIKDASIDHIREGAQATLRQLLSALERNKVIAIDPPVNTKFDPHLHQAITVVPSDQEANTVVTVLQKGFLIADRVLRPALVTVSASK